MKLNTESARQILEGTLATPTDDAVARAPEDHRPTDEAPSAPSTGSDDIGLPIEQIGQYRLIRRLGIGGWGTVFLARQEVPQRDVAIKIVRPELLAPRTHGRLLQEAEFLARVQHPGIAQIYEAGISPTPYGDQAYIAMEYVCGLPVTEYARTQNLTVAKRIELFLPICAAVEHAHRMGVIHRDLKPNNIVTTDAGLAKVLDFGLARALRHDAQHTSLLTGVGEVIGTLPFMSPEQLSGDPYIVSTQADVYALGVILYRLLGEAMPFDVADLSFPQAARRILETEPIPLRSRNPRLHGDIEVITAKAMAKERSRRYASVADFADDLRRYMDGAPVRAKRPTWSYRLSKLVRRNKGLASGALLALLAVILGITGMALKTVEADRERARAIVAADRAQANEAMAREVTRFIMEVLAAPGNDRRGPEAKIVDVLDEAASRLTDNPPQSLQVRAGMHLALGNAYQGVGNFDTAIHHLQQALTLTRSADDPPRVEIIELMKEVGRALTESGRLEEALKVLEDAEHQALESLGARHPLTARVKNARASTMKEQGRLAEARTITLGAYEVLLDSLGAESPVTRNVAIGLAYTDLELRNLVEAEAVLRDVIRSYTDQTDPMLSEAQSILGEVLMLRGAHAEAEELLRTALAYRKQRFGAAHPHTASTMLRLGPVLQLTGRCAEAVETIEAARQIRVATLGREHHVYYRAVIAQAITMARCGDSVGALTLLKEGWADARQYLGERHDVTRRCAGILIESYARRDHQTALIAIADALFPSADTLPASIGTELPGTWLHCARALLATGDVQRADALYDRFCILVPASSLPTQDSPLELLAQTLGRELVTYYTRAGRAADAERVGRLRTLPH